MVIITFSAAFPLGPKVEEWDPMGPKADCSITMTCDVVSPVVVSPSVGSLTVGVEISTDDLAFGDENKPLGRGKRLFPGEAELSFPGQIAAGMSKVASGVTWVAETMDPFQILRRIDEFELEVRRVITYATLALTLMYNLFVFSIIGFVTVKSVLLSFYLIKKVCRFLGRFIGLFTKCLVCRPCCLKKRYVNINRLDNIDDLETV